MRHDELGHSAKHTELPRYEFSYSLRDAFDQIRLRQPEFDPRQYSDLRPASCLSREDWPMGSYRVSVFKTLLSSDGHSFKCPQFVIDIARAKSAQRAIEAARCRYERRIRVPDWKSIADIVEASDMEPLPSECQPTARRSDHRRRGSPSPKHSAQDHGGLCRLRIRDVGVQQCVFSSRQPKPFPWPKQVG